MYDADLKGGERRLCGIEALENIAKLPKTLDDYYKAAHVSDGWARLTPHHAADSHDVSDAFATTYKEMRRSMKIAEVDATTKRTEKKVDRVLERLDATQDDWRSFIQSPESVFEKVRVDEFVGRAWLMEKVDAFLNDPHHHSGVLLLEGVAGVGKTAFMAHLVHLHNYSQLFAWQFPGDANVVDAIKSLAAQLVDRYATLNDYAKRDRIEDDAKESTNFLQNIIDRVARELPDGEKLVIV